MSAKLPFRSVTNTGVSAIGYEIGLLSISIGCTIFRCSLKMLKSLTDNQNWHDILQKYYIKYTQHIEVKENGKDENYTTQKDTGSSVSVTKHFLLQP